MQLTREQWRDLQRKINKGGLPAFKEIMNDMYQSACNDAYKAMIVQGMSDVKTILIETVEDVMNKELGIGKKRFEKFSTAFSEAVDKQIESIETDVVIEDHKKTDLVSENITSMIILLCVRQYIQGLFEHGSGKFELSDVKFSLNNILKDISALESIVTATMTSMEIKALYSEAALKELYLTDKVTKPEPEITG